MHPCQRFRLRFVTFVLACGYVLLACQRDDPSIQSDEAAANEASSSARPVVSREYKVLLDPVRFATEAPSDGPSMAALGELDAAIFEIVDLELERERTGTFTEVEAVRRVSFFDVAGSCDLYRQGLILRQRGEGDDHEATLKFRSVDRYLAAAADVHAASGGDARTKLEEDIQPPFQSIFSQSTTIELDGEPTLTSGDAAAELFPRLDSLRGGELAIVGNVIVDERVHGPIEIDLGKEEAEMSLTIWYDGVQPSQPIVAELSFKYGSKSEKYDEHSVRRAMQLFQHLQQLEGWTSAEAATKTAWVYSRDPSFCGEPL
jgi:hypothetical protein